MSDESILVVWVGGPFDGTQETQKKAEAIECRGRTIVQGGINYKQSALYQCDDDIAADGRLYLRFVRLMGRPRH